VFGPVLHGAVIALEPPRPEDSALRARWFADVEVARLYTSPGVPIEVEDQASAERAARDSSVVLWRIAHEGRAIGSCFLLGVDWKNRQALSGMMIGERSLWGRGFGTEAVRLRTGFAFEELGLERLETSSIDVNVGMHRALERSGYRRIARRSRRFFIEGSWHDELVFELLRQEWAEARSAQQPGP
jgi:RimJ/RimL family protein N-acetyltransferase